MLVQPEGLGLITSSNRRPSENSLWRLQDLLAEESLMLRQARRLAWLTTRRDRGHYFRISAEAQAERWGDERSAPPQIFEFTLVPTAPSSAFALHGKILVTSTPARGSNDFSGKCRYHTH